MLQGAYDYNERLCLEKVSTKNNGVCPTRLTGFPAKLLAIELQE